MDSCAVLQVDFTSGREAIQCHALGSKLTSFTIAKPLETQPGLETHVLLFISSGKLLSW